MLRLTLAQMRRSIGRLAAAGVAILLGAAFLTATLTAGDVITRGSYDAMTAAYGEADLVVATGSEPLADALATVRSTPGVRAADPGVFGWTTFSTGRRAVTEGLIAAPSDPGLASLDVVEGRAPRSAAEVALPTASAERMRVGVGDTLRVQWLTWPSQDTATAGPADARAGAPTQEETPTATTADVTLVGLVEDPRGAWARYGGAGLATLDAVVQWSGAASLDELGASGVVVAVDGDANAVRADLAAALPDADVLTRDEAAERAIEARGGGNVILMVVIGFAAVALLVAALVIANTFQVIVAQRVRMLALLRCVGARRSQLRAAVLLEAAVLGVVSGAAGVVTGLALSQAMLVVVTQTPDGVPLPTTVHPTPANVLVPALVAVAVTVGAALLPAHAATVVPPVAALRPAEAPSVRGRPGRVRLVLSAVLAGGGAATLVGAVVMARSGAGVEAMLPLLVGVLGGATSFVGLLVGTPLWVPRVVAAVGRPVAATSASARLATANTLRNPRRTAATSTALVIGVTLVVMMSTGALSAQRTIAQEMDERGPVDMLVLSTTGRALDDGVEADVAGVDGVRTVVPTRSGPVTGPDGVVLDSLVVAPDARAVLRDAVAVEALTAGRAVVPEWWGEVTALELSATSTADVDVVTRGTERALLPTDVADALGVGEATSALLVRLDDDADAATAMRDVQDVVSSDTTRVESAAAQRQGDEQVIDVMLAVVIGLLGVAVVIALIGVANTLSLSVIERRRESATLRAVGLSRRGLRWMLATEGMLIAGVGALIGTVLGLLYGWAGTATVFGPLGDVGLSVPWLHVGAVLVVALLAGLVASALPARAAARTPPVSALGVD